MGSLMKFVAQVVIVVREDGSSTLLKSSINLLQEFIPRLVVFPFQLETKVIELSKELGEAVIALHEVVHFVLSIEARIVGPKPLSEQGKSVRGSMYMAFSAGHTDPLICEVLSAIDYIPQLCGWGPVWIADFELELAGIDKAVDDTVVLVALVGLGLRYTITSLVVRLGGGH
jgi:hypothetical protein